VRKKNIVTITGLAMIVLTIICLAFTSFAHTPERNVNQKNGGVGNVTTKQKGILKYFNTETGHVDKEAVEDMASRVPEQMHALAFTKAESKIRDAVSQDILSADQADELRTVLKEELL
jgi:hypothetical protein